MRRSEFEALVEAALEGLPPRFAKRLENVEVIVQPEPTRRQLKESRVKAGGLLLGLYVGIPPGDRSVFDASVHYPDRIFIFQRPIESLSGDPEEIIHQVRETVVHEVGHHFGLSDAEIYRITGEHMGEEEE